MPTGEILLPPGAGYDITTSAALWKVFDGTNADTDHLEYPSGTILQKFWTFEIPNDYSSAPAFLLQWRSTATAGQVLWDIGLAGVGSGSSTDPILGTTTGTSTAVGTARNLSTVTITATATLATSQYAIARIIRQGTHGSDGMTGTAELVMVIFKYTTT